MDLSSFIGFINNSNQPILAEICTEITAIEVLWLYTAAPVATAAWRGDTLCDKAALSWWYMIHGNNTPAHHIDTLDIIIREAFNKKNYFIIDIRQ